MSATGLRQRRGADRRVYDESGGTTEMFHVPDEDTPLIARDDNGADPAANERTWGEYMYGMAASVYWYFLLPAWQSIASTFSRPQPFELDPEAQERMDAFRAVAQQKYSSENPDHEDRLMVLWNGFSPDTPLTARVCDDWKHYGFQGKDPATDFRGAGLFGLENLIYFVETYPHAVPRMLGDQDDMESYPFAIAGLNITMLLMDYLGWGFKPVEIPEPARASVLKLLFDTNGMRVDELGCVNGVAFEELYSYAFVTLDVVWREMGASYMDFPVVIEETRNRVNTAFASFESVEDVTAATQGVVAGF